MALVEVRRFSQVLEKQIGLHILLPDIGEPMGAEIAIGNASTRLARSNDRGDARRLSRLVLQQSSRP
jgi:hypothetical protein